jgi:septal ring factor EnvC (AmiA/AmiB activator)
MRTRQKLDVDAVIGYNRQQVDLILKTHDQEVAELDGRISELIREKNQLQNKIELLQDEIQKIQQIKINEGAASKVWAAFTMLAAAIGALIMSVFDEKDK